MLLTPANTFRSRLWFPSGLSSLANSAAHLQYKSVSSFLRASGILAGVRVHTGAFSGYGLAHKSFVQFIVMFPIRPRPRPPWHWARNPVQEREYIDDACSRRSQLHTLFDGLRMNAMYQAATEREIEARRTYIASSRSGESCCTPNAAARVALAGTLSISELTKYHTIEKD